MSSTPPPGGTSGLIARILGFIDKPWKAVVIVVLLVTGVITATAWERRAEFAEAILQNWVRPQLQPARFQKTAARLMANTKADLVALAAVSTRSNLITNIDGLRRDDPGWTMALNPRPLYGAIRDPTRYIAFVEGRPICHDLDPSDGEEERAETELGLRRRCYIAVPPVLDALVGILAIGWRQPLSPEAETGATSLLWQAATELAVW